MLFNKSFLLKDHLLQGAFAYSTLRLIGLGGKRAPWRCFALQLLDTSAVAWCFRQAKSYRKYLGIEPKANPFPTDLIFGRSLHFIAALRVPTNAGGN